MAQKRLKRPRDPIQLAKLIGDIATGQVEDRDEVHFRPRLAGVQIGAIFDIRPALTFG